MWTRCVILLAVITVGPTPTYSKPTEAPAPTAPTAPTDSKGDNCGECCDIDFDNCPVKEEPKDKLIVCYYAKWAKQRAPPAGFTPQNIDPKLCTHVSYAFSVLDSNTLQITEWVGKGQLEEETNTYKEITKYKEQGLIVMMSIGGSEDSTDGDKWSRMIASDSAREKFVKSALDFLVKYKFDGIDIAFSANKPADKEKFTKLIKELKQTLNGKLLSVFGTSSITRIEKSYDMAAICKEVDWVNMGSYEYHNSDDETTGAQAPICRRPDGIGVYDAVNYYLKTLECPPEKMVLGVAFFASSYTLKDPSKPEFGVQTTGTGNPGPYLNMKGYLSYSEVCHFVNKDGWSKGLDKHNGDFIYKGNQFASSPSVGEMGRKSSLINHLKLKGINLWTMDYDDFSDVCGCGKYPLLKTLNKHLRGLKTETEIQCF